MTMLYFGDMLPPSREDEGRRDHVLVGTAAPVQLEVRPVEHHLTPEGTVCIATFHEGHAIGRCAIPEESVEDFLEMDLFDEPVALALNVRVGGPGIEASLLALVPMDQTKRRRDEPDEPWRASVPGVDYEKSSDEESGDAAASQLVGIFLGEIVRFERDRKDSDSMLREAADMLAGVIRGDVEAVVDRVIAELTGQPEA